LQRRPGIADHVQLVWVAHTDPLAGAVDLHGSRLTELGQELRVREVGTDREKGVALHHQMPTGGGAQQADGAGDPWQVVRQNVLAE
jgi:hypothetical protein